MKHDCQQIFEHAVACAQEYLRSELTVLDAIISVDGSRTYEEYRCTHLTPFCVKYMKLSQPVAETFVRVARKSLVVPELKAALERGDLTITTAKTLAAVITPANQREWIQAGASLSKAELEKKVAAANPRAVRPARLKPVGPDRQEINFELSDEAAARTVRAQEILCQKLGRMVGLDEVHDLAVLDFLNREDPVRVAERVARRAEASRRPKVKRERSREHSREEIPAASLHEVNLRDRGGCCERLLDGSLCGERRWVHVHHVRPVSEGGGNEVDNLVTLCSSHHRWVHRRG